MNLGTIVVYRKGIQADMDRKHQSSMMVSMPMMVSFSHTTILNVLN